MTFPSKATHQQTRAYNAALVLRALYDFGPISRAEVARLSGLSRFVQRFLGLRRGLRLAPPQALFRRRLRRLRVPILCRTLNHTPT